MTEKHTHLYLVRHGETNSNVNLLLHGRTDVPLNDHGRSQAERIGERMTEFPELDRIVSSPLQRALHTAQAIQRRTDLPLETMEGLEEMNFGDAEGIVYNELENVFPDESSRLLDPEEFDVRYPNGETRREFFERVKAAIERITESYAGQHVVVVAHGGVIAATLSLLLADDPDNWRERPIRNTSLTHIELATEGPVGHLVNDVVHLEQMTLAPGNGKE